MIKSTIITWVFLFVQFVFVQGQDNTPCSLTKEGFSSMLQRENSKEDSMQLYTCLNSGDPTIQYYLGLLFYKWGNDSSATTHFERALELNIQSTGYVHMHAARSFARWWHDDEAIEHIESAITAGAVVYPWFRSTPILKLKERNARVAMLFEQQKPSFNSWTLLFIPIIFIAFLQSLLFFTWSQRFHSSTKFLAWLTLVIAVIMTSYVLYWTKFAFDFSYLVNWYHPLYFAIGPLYYLYLRTIFSANSIIKTSSIALHFVPFLLVFICSLPLLLRAYDIQLKWPNDIVFIGTHYLFKLAHLTIYFIASLSIFRHEKQIDDYINAWSKVIIACFGLFLLANISYYVLVSWEGFQITHDYFISIVMALSILAIGVFGFIQPEVFRSVPVIKALQPIKKYRTSGLTENASLSLKKELEDLMKEHEVYKENELRLQDLANYLNASKHHVSQVINTHYGVNFFDFINTYRIEHVARLLCNPNRNKDTIIQLAYDAGFNNKVSFNKAFKQHFNMTPSAYRKLKSKEAAIKKLERNN